MTIASVVQRLEAWRRGAPVARGETCPWPRSEKSDRLILAFVRMAGESRPWGFAAGHPGDEPTVVTIPEPRDASESARLALDLAAILLPHLPHPDHATDEQKADVAAIARRRQLWMPGATHVEMLHFLDYRFTWSGLRDVPSARSLGALGRAAGWLFRESNRPGQVRVFDATRRLRDAFAIPAEDVRQQHLGFLLAWLSGFDDGAASGPKPRAGVARVQASRDERVAAARLAEASSVGVTMSPDLERRQLEPLVRRWNERRENAEDAARIAASIHAVLAPELTRRFRLVEAALEVLERDRAPNTGLADVLDLGVEEFTWQCWNNEQKALAPTVDPDAPRFYGDHPETDFLPTHAAARFFAHVHAAELTVASLVHGDRHLVEDAIDGGDAIRGTIAQVVNEGSKRAVVPVWTVTSLADRPLRLREETRVCVVGLRGRTGQIRTLTVRDGVRTIVVEIDGWKRARPEDGAPAAESTALVGSAVILVDAGVVGMARRKSMRVWDASGPGAWLTHAAPSPEPSADTPPAADLVDLVEKLGGA